jgi:ABC-type transporter Mla subunit MlaD
MSDHALAEGLAGLASRVDSLSHLTAGAKSRTLEDQEDRLAKLTLAAIALDMDATNAKYQDAVNRVQTAIDAIGDADKKIQNVAQIISRVAKALDVTEKLLTKLAGV